MNDMQSAAAAVTPGMTVAMPAEASLRGNRIRLTSSKLALVLLCVSLIGAFGYVDYRTGYEQTFLLFYLAPIALGTWYGSGLFGFILSLLSIAAWLCSDMAAGVPTLGWWNTGMAFGSYVVFTVLLAKLRALFQELDKRVRDRTAALKREMAARERLDREIAGVADRERRRLGQELHDSLCQHLTGIALTAESMRENMAARGAPEVSEMDKVVRYLEEGIDMTRNMARGFFSPELDADGLSVALQGLAENMSERFGAQCNIDIGEHVPVTSSGVATQLYRIAQEAVMNAIKHAEPQKIDISLSRAGKDVCLEICDDGTGFPVQHTRGGLGLRLMSHGAAMIGARFRIEPRVPRGTRVICQLSSDAAQRNIPYEPQA